MWGYFDRSSVFYRNWGRYDVLEQNVNDGTQVSKVAVFPGKTIFSHLHEKKKEIWSVIAGKGKAVIGEKELVLGVGDTIEIDAKTQHQISCVSDTELIFIETSVGNTFAGKDNNADNTEVSTKKLYSLSKALIMNIKETEEQVLMQA